MAKTAGITEDDEITIRAMQAGLFQARDGIEIAINGAKSLIASYNGRSDSDGVQIACEAREALTYLLAERDRVHNALSRLLVSQYGREEAAKIILIFTKGGGGR